MNSYRRQALGQTFADLEGHMETLGLLCQLPGNDIFHNQLDEQSSSSTTLSPSDDRLGSQVETHPRQDQQTTRSDALWNACDAILDISMPVSASTRQRSRTLPLDLQQESAQPDSIDWHSLVSVDFGRSGPNGHPTSMSNVNSPSSSSRPESSHVLHGIPKSSPSSSKQYAREQGPSNEAGRHVNHDSAGLRGWNSNKDPQNPEVERSQSINNDNGAQGMLQSISLMALPAKDSVEASANQLASSTVVRPTSRNLWNVSEDVGQALMLASRPRDYEAISPDPFLELPEDLLDIGYRDAAGAWRCKHQECKSNRTFSRACDLRKHFTVHQKPYVCAQRSCAAAFASAKDLRRHQATHAPCIRCPDSACSRVFSRHDNMKDHYKRIHWKCIPDRYGLAFRSKNVTKLYNKTKTL